MDVVGIGLFVVVVVVGIVLIVTVVVVGAVFVTYVGDGVGVLVLLLFY